MTELGLLIIIFLLASLVYVLITSVMDVIADKLGGCNDMVVAWAVGMVLFGLAIVTVVIVAGS